MSRGPNVIEHLRELQRKHGWITDKAMTELAGRIGEPIHELRGVASFYPEFHLRPPPRVTVRVCTALPCQMKQSEVLVRILQKAAAGHADVRIERAPCLGACDRAPAAIVGGKLQTCGGHHTARTIVDTVRTAIAGTGQTHSLLPRGIAGPFRTDPYGSAADRFGTVRKLLAANDFSTVLATIKTANLRGMGGAGKPAARKWEQVAEQTTGEKFVVANADESEPGTLKDREILRNVPHLVVEGMIIAGLTLGATQGYIYLRHEYEEQHHKLEAAIAEARGAGLIGKNLRGTGRDFELRVFVSPGGYVLGEASALLEALEGKRGQPRNQIVDLGLRNGVPSYNGLWGKPTLVNNVETYCYVPVILARGPDWFKAQGVNKSEGLKWASVCGDVEKPGVFEISLGTSFRELIERAGGVKGGWDQFKAFAPSGPTSGFRPPADVDQTMEFRTAPGVAVGSGAIIVLDKTRCMVDAALNFTRFLRNESCGKCVPCRLGSQQMVELIKSARGGLGEKAAAAFPDTLGRLDDVLVKGSICGLGQIVPTAIQSVRKYWPDDVSQHLQTGRCSASGCPSIQKVTS